MWRISHSLPFSIIYFSTIKYNAKYLFKYKKYEVRIFNCIRIIKYRQVHTYNIILYDCHEVSMHVIVVGID